jgi:hypothetical protein
MQVIYYTYAGITRRPIIKLQVTNTKNKMTKTISQAKAKALRDDDDYNLGLIEGIEKDFLRNGFITPAEKEYLISYLNIS